jgi:hypothetical protein
MSFLRSLKIFFSRRGSPKSSTPGRSLRGTDFVTSRDFSADYNEAMQMLSDRINKKFPDNYQAAHNSNRDYSRDYGNDRAAAIDTASAAIATALRKGATVNQAAEAGATSIGI